MATFKHLALAVAMMLATGPLRALFGEHSVGIGILCGLASYWLAGWLLASPVQRQQRVASVIAAMHDNISTLLDCAALLAIGTYCYANRVIPTHMLVKDMYDGIYSLGLLVIAAPFVVIFVRTALSSTPKPIVALCTAIVRGTSAWAFALWLIGYAGDDLYEVLRTDPARAAAYAFTAWLAWAIIRFSIHAASSAPAYTGRLTSFRAAKKDPPTIVLEHDRRYAAAHEAGHVLLYAALTHLPSNLRLAIRTTPDQNGVLGYVTTARTGHLLAEKTYSEWLLLVYLAGQRGESRLTGEVTNGATSDYAEWVQLARQFLAVHGEGIYYPEPLNEHEQRLNDEKLAQLRAQQISALDTFFDTNEIVHRELTDALLANEELDRDDVATYLQRVLIPDSFPHPAIDPDW